VEKKSEEKKGFCAARTLNEVEEGKWCHVFGEEE
jgi:hypothetical protein